MDDEGWRQRRCGVGNTKSAKSAYSRAIMSGLLGAACVCLNTTAVSAGEGYAISGIGGGPDNLYAYQGLLFAPLDGLSASGPQIRLWSKAFIFTYHAGIPGNPDAEIKATGTSLEAEAGWQFAGDHGRIAFLAGAAWRDHKLSPNDPGSDLKNGRIGFSATMDGELKLSDGFGVMAYANYITSFDQFWLQTRPYAVVGDGWKVGPEFVVSGGKDYTHGRAGLFFSGYEIALGSMGRIFVGGEAGARFDFEDRNIDPYAGLNAGFLF